MTNAGLFKYLILLIIFIVLSFGQSWADPFLVCDPQAGVSQYRIVDPDGATTVSAETDGSVKWDIAGLPPGTADRTLAAGNEYTLDGMPTGVMAWSDPVPFVLGVPPEPSSSTGIGLSEK